MELKQRVIVSFFLVLGIGLAWFPSSALADTSTKYALAVGFDDYSPSSGGYADLTGQADNAADIKAVLTDTDTYAIPAGNVEVYTSAGIVSEAQLESAITTLLAHQDSDLFVIYLAGHGIEYTSTTNSAFILPNGDVFTDLDLQGLLADVWQQVVVIVDMHNGGGFVTNVASNRVVVISATSVGSSLAWSADETGGEFTNILCDAFDWHGAGGGTTGYADWASYSGASQPTTADVDSDNIVDFEEAYNYVVGAYNAYTEAIIDASPNSQIGGQIRTLAFDSLSLAEAIDYTDIVTTSGDANWLGLTTTVMDSSTAPAARNYTITASQSSSMSLTPVTGPGVLTFDWKVSSEINADYLKFYVNGVERFSISGSVDWQSKSVAYADASTYSFTWTYVKDDGADSGSDAGWVAQEVVAILEVSHKATGFCSGAKEVRL